MSALGDDKDYYSILGASETASQREIERLYKILARRHHPDRGGNVEDMKVINEAYRVLGNADTRRNYDSLRQPHQDPQIVVTPPLSPPSMLVPDSVLGRLTAAFFILLAALIFLFLVKVYYIRFMWPLIVLAVFVVIFGVWKVHQAMVLARKRAGGTHQAWRYVWLQELVFWSMVCGGAYGIFLLMRGI